MDKGTPEWGKHLAECVANGYGVMITENIAAVRLAARVWGIQEGEKN